MVSEEVSAGLLCISEVSNEDSCCPGWDLMTDSHSCSSLFMERKFKYFAPSPSSPLHSCYPLLHKKLKGPIQPTHVTESEYREYDYDGNLQIDNKDSSGSFKLIYFSELFMFRTNMSLMTSLFCKLVITEITRMFDFLRDRLNMSLQISM